MADQASIYSKLFKHVIGCFLNLNLYYVLGVTHVMILLPSVES